MDKMLDNMQDKIIHNLKKTIGEQDINFTGNMTNSIHKHSENNTKSVVIDSPYAHIVDKGLSSGTYVNFDALREWVKGKLGIDEENLTDVTWKILRKINKDGIKPKFFVKKALKKFIGKYGVITPTRMRSNNGSKTLGKINKIIRIAKKISKNINKVSKNIGRFK